MMGLIDAVIKQESGGNPRAVSPKGAMGLMQIMPATAQSPGFGIQPVAVDQLFDPKVNRQFGEQYLGAMIDRYKGDTRRALVAYNWGPGNADKWDGRMETLPAETRQYVGNIEGMTGTQVADASTGGITRQSIIAEIERRKAQAAQPQITRDAVLAEIERRKGLNSDPSPISEEPSLEDATQGALQTVTEGITLGRSDEITAFARALLGGDPDESFWEEYERFLSEEVDTREQFAEENPISATTAEVASGLVLPLGAGRAGLTLMRAGQGVARASAAGGAEAGIYGAVYGAGKADSDEVIDQALATGGMSAVLGGVLAGGVQKIVNGVARREAVRALQPTADLKIAADQAYAAAEALGAKYAPRQVDALITRLEAAATKQALDPELHKGAAAAVRRIQDLKGKGASLSEIDNARQIIARDAAGSNVKGDRAIGAEMIEIVDDFIERSLPRASTTGAEARKASRAIKDARTKWSTFRKSEMIDSILLEAADQAAAGGSGGNINNAIRQKFKSLLSNKKKSRGFSAEERGHMRRIVRGTSTDNMLRLVGKLAPSGNGLMLMLNLGAAGATGGASLVATGFGAGAKALADRGTQKAAGALQQVVKTGQAPNRVRGQTTPEQRALFQTLAKELGFEITAPDPGSLPPRKAPVPQP